MLLYKEHTIIQSVCYLTPEKYEDKINLKIKIKSVPFPYLFIRSFTDTFDFENEIDLYLFNTF